MRMIPAGNFEIGSSGKFDTAFGPKYFPEEAPARTVHVKAFQIDETEVTNREFRKFVESTGYVTFAERIARLEDFPEEARSNLPSGPFRQGSVIFSPPRDFSGNLRSEDAYRAWWIWDPEANWRHPNGKDSSIEGLDDSPVVCVNHEDAVVYAKWAGKRLPTEIEWEAAAKGGLAGKMYAWGNEMRPDGKIMANTFQGKFPNFNSCEDGYAGTSPVKQFSPNGYGLYDMSGNVWEICADVFQSRRPDAAACEVDENGKPKPSFPATQEGNALAYVIKGGSYLCHISYCMRYRPAARESMEDGSPTNHIGFRCVIDIEHASPGE
ncbi:MAG: formylglycine-generating enzyme family protein [Luteolibacter sp.]